MRLFSQPLIVLDYETTGLFGKHDWAEPIELGMDVRRWPKLSAAAEHYGVAVVGEAHRAETDARTAAGIAIAIRRAEVRP